MLLGWAPGFVGQLRPALKDPDVPGLDARMFERHAEASPWLRESSGGRWGEHGWYVGPRGVGRLRIQLPGERSGTIKLRLWIYDAGSLQVSVESEGEQHSITSSSLYGEIRSVEVRGRAALLVEAANTGAIDQLILASIDAAWIPANSGLPSLWPFALILAVSLTGGGWLAFAERQVHLSHGAHVFQQPVFWLGCAALCGALVVGMDLRWMHLDLYRGLELEPDVADDWRPFARKFEWFSDSVGFYSGAFGMREPLYIVALHHWLQLWGDSNPSVRLFTFCLSSLVIVVTGVFLWRLTRQWWMGALGAWVVALSPEWVDLAARGLRDEAATLLLLGFLSIWLWTRGATGMVGIGVMGGLVGLVRSPLLGVVLPFVWGQWIVNWVRRRLKCTPLFPDHWNGLQLAVASGLVIVLYLPYLQGVARVHGDSSWPSARQARWNANVEFPERLGTMGWPSREEFAKDPFGGPPISYREYLFELHSVSTIIWRQVRGWAEQTGFLAVSGTPGPKHLVWNLLGIGSHSSATQVPAVTVAVFAVYTVSFVVGWLGLWRQRGYQWVPFLCLWGTWYAAFMYASRLIEPFRQTCHVFPLILLCQVWGAWWLLSRFQFSSRSPRWSAAQPRMPIDQAT